MRIRTPHIQELKERGEPIPCVTAYDYPTACLADRAAIPLVLVGDSLGNVVLGHDSTIPVTMEEMIHHTRAVARGIQRALLVADMPFMSYQVSVERALMNAGRLLQEGGAHAVKLEGGARSVAVVRRLVETGIPVMGHLGLTPQSVHQLGGYRVQGRTEEAAQGMLRDAEALQEAGAFAIVLESVPTALAKVVTESLRVPTIGIGAGRFCDGQVQVLHDLLGFTSDSVPRHAKQYAQVGEVIFSALRAYAEEVRGRDFPTDEHAHSAGDAMPGVAPRKLRGHL